MMKTLWLLYDDIDYAVNQGFARMMQERGEPLGLDVQAVVLSELVLGMDENGQPTCLRNGSAACPDAILSRQRQRKRTEKIRFPLRIFQQQAFQNSHAAFKQRSMDLSITDFHIFHRR